MSSSLPVGPYRHVTLPNGDSAPFYIVPFDKKGRCTGPKTRDHLLQAVELGSFTDLFLFSHGWNNDWSVSTKRYNDFIDQYQELVASQQLTLDRDYRPILVGIFWPSTSLVMPWERGPQIAAASAEQAEQEYLSMLQDAADSIPEAQLEEYYALAAEETLDLDGARRLASILAPLYSQVDDPVEDEAEAISAEDLVAHWSEAFPEQGDGTDSGDADFGFAGETFVQPQSAGLLSFLDPRKAIRAFTVWKMKDRAGVVGASGVHVLLRDLLDADDTPHAHLVGHSYGCKVVLSAVCAGDLPRGVESALLLQPAINGYCFAADVPRRDVPGGYRKALGVIRQPILSTFSRHDAPLTKFFHLAVRRKTDLGEIQIAADIPSRYAALGGYGPRGLEPAEVKQVDIAMPPNRYDLDPATAPEVYGVKGDAHIDGHGGIVKVATAWALHCQVHASPEN